ncbi:MAG: nuclear transport factor 2 family protein [Ignavibacteriales bacterium]
MRKLILLPVLMLITVQLNAQQATEKQNVIYLLKQMDKAVASKDSVVLSKILTDDFTGSIPNGQNFNKKSYISFHCNPQSKVRELKEEPTSNWDVRLFGNLAVINRTITSLAKTPGKEKPVEIQTRRLEVCIKVKERWHITAQQGTEVLKK